MATAIYYEAEAYGAGRMRPMGRTVVGRSFLRAWVDHEAGAPARAVLHRPSDADPLRTELAALGAPPPQVLSHHELVGGTIHYPSPELARFSHRRTPFGTRAWSMTGVTHTLSSAELMDDVTGLLSAAVEPWDAVICTAPSARDSVLHLLERQARHLRDRYGATKFPVPHLPVIPLGIHTGDFAFTAADRAAARAVFGLDDQAIAVLYAGRLSFHAKAHPAALYAALEQAAAGRDIVLMESGQFPNPAVADAFDAAARALAPSIRRIVVDGSDDAAHRRVWAAADIFASLSDNIQETFGLTPVEAMAAGLPVVVSDWNGYKETVRDGVDGFRIPTLMPRAGLGLDLARRRHAGLINYDHYIGYVSTLTAVDIAAATRAFTELFASADLRRRLGEAGRARARQLYDWPVVLGRYDELWRELAAVRTAGVATPFQPAPARPDPFALFASYPTVTLSEQTRLALVHAELDAGLAVVAAHRALSMTSYADFVIPTDAEIRTMLTAAHDGGATALELIADIAADRKGEAMRGLAWLMKAGVLRLADPVPPA